MPGYGFEVSRLTIIIPCLRDTPTEVFEETLASVLLYKPKDCEILIADGCGYADPWNVASDGVRFVSTEDRSHPIDVLNEAVRQSDGSILHILFPGTEVSENWTDFPLTLFETQEIGIVIPSVFDRQKPKRVFAFGICYHRSGVLRTIRRSLWPEASQMSIVPHISAVFFRKAALQQMNLLNRSFLPQIAYAEATFAMLDAGWKTQVDPNCRILVRPNHLPGSNPFVWGLQIERLYFRRLGREASLWSLGSHFASFASDFWRQLPKLKAFHLLAGRLTGICFFGEILFSSSGNRKQVTVNSPPTVPTETRTAKLPDVEQDCPQPVKKTA